MPEGDVIHYHANRLAPVLVGRVLERVTTQGLARAITGRTVTAVTAHGKHLIVDLDDDTRIRTHLGMNGRVRLYGREEGDARIAQMSPGRASLVLVTAETVTVWVTAKTVEIAARRAPMRDMRLASLGPDVLLADDFDPAAAERAAQHGSRRIADVLLDQSVASGIGNIFKTESLFACSIDPRSLVQHLDRATVVAVYTAARELMSRPRHTHAIYSRTRQPCPRCTAAIDCYQLGDPPRWTWSCPRCQLVAVAGAVAGDGE